MNITNITKDITKEQIYGYAGSIIFGIILLLVLLFSVLRTVISAESEGGVFVNFGIADEASGLFEPEGQGGELVDQDDQTQAVDQSSEDVITQNMEETLALAAEKKKEAAEKTAAERKKQEEARINNRVAGAFGAGSTPGAGATPGGDSEGTGSGTGNQGSMQGNVGTGAYSGVGSFSLDGRSLGKDGLPKPGYAVQVEGVIVIDITANPQGYVIYATIGKGTTIDNQAMRQSALEAARKAQFNSISDGNNQLGKITYRYKLK